MAIKRTRESEEMYLETILLLHKGQPNVRAVDVRDELGLAKSSVSRGVNLLEKKGYIHIDREIYLTCKAEMIILYIGSQEGT